MEIGAKEFYEGEKARRAGKPKTDNPYKAEGDDASLPYWETMQRRNAWLRGWQSLSIM